MVRNMSRPKIELGLDFLASIHRRTPPGPLDAGATPPWQEIAGPVLRAARAVAAREPLTFVIVVKTRRHRGPGTVEVRIVHEGTCWAPRKLKEAVARPDRVYVVSAAGVRHHPPDNFDLATARQLVRLQTRATPSEAA